MWNWMRMSDEDTSQTVKHPAVKKRRTAQEEREERVQSTIEKLKDKHGASFIPIQIRIWAEMVAGDLHFSLDERPKSSMFAMAGNEAARRRRMVISVRSWSYQAAINKGHPLHVDGLEGVLPVPEILLRSLGYRWKDKKKVVCVVDTQR